MSKNLAYAPPKLKRLEDLYQDSELQNIPAPESMRFGKAIRQVISVDLNLPIPFAEHPFVLYEGERLQDMVESIQQYGVMTPVVLRWNGKALETLAGHNRIQAARLAGLQEIPATILYNISDQDALAIVIETNFRQRSFSDMRYSERAAVIELQYSKLYAQGKRNDIVLMLRDLEQSTTSSHNETKLRSDEKIGQTYGLSRASIARYLRVNKLITALKRQLDASAFPFASAVELSFLPEDAQQWVSDCIALNRFKLDAKKTAMLRECASNEKLDDATVYLILSGEALQNNAKKAKRTPKIRRSTYTRFFRPEQSEQEVQNIISEALALYFQAQSDNE